MEAAAGISEEETSSWHAAIGADGDQQASEEGGVTASDGAASVAAPGAVSSGWPTAASSQEVPPAEALASAVMAQAEPAGPSPTVEPVGSPWSAAMVLAPDLTAGTAAGSDSEPGSAAGEDGLSFEGDIRL
jgi:hypothetical protein